jgi:hypothetical protein
MTIWATGTWLSRNGTLIGGSALKRQASSEPASPDIHCPRSIITGPRRKRVVSELLSEAKRSTKSARVVIDSDESDLVLVGVTARDWPGLATIVLSELHHCGWNLDLMEAFTAEFEGMRYGFVITGIRDTDSDRRNKFENDAIRIEGLLKRLAEGRAGTVSLLSRAAERLEKFEDVSQDLVSLYKGEPPDEVIGAKGELVLFISSRSDEYLRERKSNDLAWMIKTNYELVHRVRSSSGKAVFRFRNLKTTREHLTGINIAGYERDISFQDVVTSLSFAWPGSAIKHQRKYTTSDGIISIRVEMSGPSGLSATKGELSHIRKSLQKLLVSNELEKLKKIHRYGGREHYARALIPLLLRECESTQLNQAYIALLSTSTFEAELKLLLVSLVGSESEHDNLVIALVGRIDSYEGLTVVSFKSPSSYGNRWVDILDITVHREELPDLEAAYDAIKQSVETTFGRFRDFDMGMRLNDVSQLKEIRKQLRGIPENVITDFYYRLEDFLRAAAPVGELIAHIKLAFDCLSMLVHEGERKTGPSWIEICLGDNRIATLFCCVKMGKADAFQDLLEAVKEFRITASVIEWSGASAVLLRIQDNEHALDEMTRERVIRTLSKTCH